MDLMAGMPSWIVPIKFEEELESSSDVAGMRMMSVSSGVLRRERMSAWRVVPDLFGATGVMVDLCSVAEIERAQLSSYLY